VATSPNFGNMIFHSFVLYWHNRVVRYYYLNELIKDNPIKVLEDNPPLLDKNSNHYSITYKENQRGKMESLTKAGLLV
jgi:hypothetical protein